MTPKEARAWWNAKHKTPSERFTEAQAAWDKAGEVATVEIERENAR